MFEKTTTFIREAIAELKRVTWPSRKELAGSTLVVLIVVAILMTFIALFDFLLTLAVRLIMR